MQNLFWCIIININPLLPNQENPIIVDFFKIFIHRIVVCFYNKWIKKIFLPYISLVVFVMFVEIFLKKLYRLLQLLRYCKYETSAFHVQ